MLEDKRAGIDEMRRSWCYRPSPIDGSKDFGWSEITATPEDVGISAALPAGQSNVMCYSRDEIWSYHTITDTWAQIGQSDKLKSFSRIVQSGDRILLLPQIDADGGGNNFNQIIALFDAGGVGEFVRITFNDDGGANSSDLSVV